MSKQKSFTKLPYRYQVEGEGDDLYDVYYGHPPERLTKRMVNAALTRYDEDKTDRHLRKLRKLICGHSFDAFLTKLAAIDSLAGANGKELLKVAEMALAWARNEPNFRTFEEFLVSGSPEDAQRLMTDVGEKVRGCRSLMSKYLAYHDARWVIYDSFVRHYLWATYRGIEEQSVRSARQLVKSDPPLFATQKELKNYSSYCQAIRWTWRMLNLNRRLSARKMEYVLWHRAKNCRVAHWTPGKAKTET